MIEKGVEPNPITYGAILVAMSKEKLPLEVERLFLEMRNKGLKAGPLVWRYVIESFVRSNQMDKAFILVDQMISEGIKVKGVLKNILLVHCKRKNKLKWYTQRFGEVDLKEDQTISLFGRERGARLKQYDQYYDDPRLDWNFEGEGLSVVSEAKKKREEEESHYEERLKILEREFLKESLRPDHKEAMLGSQKKLATKKREEKILPEYVPKTIKKKKKPVVKSKDPNAPRKPKRKTTPKDTRKPRAQFYFKDKI